jgi:hypothetical protein
MASKLQKVENRWSKGLLHETEKVETYLPYLRKSK